MNQDPFRRIAETTRSPLLVLAGPGTGKTFALTQRVAWLLSAGSDPQRILAVTFTRTAASDLGRALERLGVDGAEIVRAGTLHAFCFSLLRKSEVFETTGRVARPLMPFEERFLLQDLDRAEFGGIRDRERRLEAFSAAWARLQTQEPGWPADEVDRRFQDALLRWLRFHRAIMVGELVFLAWTYLSTNPASQYRRVFEHVLVDEYQDLNRAEQALVDLLAERAMLAVFGDEDQSIYAFKCAHPEGIAQFEESHPGAVREDLGECRRCPRRVIQMANSLISHNVRRTPRLLVARAGNPEGEIHLVQWNSLEEEAAGLTRFVRHRVEGGSVGLGDVLVLATRRKFGYALRDALNEAGVLAQSFFHEEALEGNPREPDSCRAQEAFTLLTLLADAEDRVALRAWCGFGSPSLRLGEWARLREVCENTGDSPSDVLQALADDRARIAHTRDIVERYRLLRARMAELQDLRGDALMNALFPPDAGWAAPMQRVAAAIGIGDWEPQELREQLRTAITQPELPTGVDYVRVMSLHKAKGLTARLVIVVGCLEGILPAVERDTPEAERVRQFEEQRRLFYVAITRSTDTLIISSVTRLPRDLAHQLQVQVARGGGRRYANTIASRFLAELGPARPDPMTGNDFLRRTVGGAA